MYTMTVSLPILCAAVWGSLMFALQSVITTIATFSYALLRNLLGVSVMMSSCEKIKILSAVGNTVTDGKLCNYNVDITTELQTLILQNFCTYKAIQAHGPFKSILVTYQHMTDAKVHTVVLDMTNSTCILCGTFTELCEVAQNDTIAN